MGWYVLGRVVTAGTCTTVVRIDITLASSLDVILLSVYERCEDAEHANRCAFRTVMLYHLKLLVLTPIVFPLILLDFTVVSTRNVQHDASAKMDNDNHDFTKHGASLAPRTETLLTRSKEKAPPYQMQ